ncbi:MAG: M12 family metallo-peptidase [Candidatus Symbiothrix sp.]|jgi:hypothetical protein|nr:M12 family metallo-peptidase [Candidatus Symbiothrix sp.]
MKKTLLLFTLIITYALQIQAQFLIGTPDRDVARRVSTEEWRAAKAVHGNMFVREGIVALNRANINDQSIQTALLTENLLSIQLFEDVTVTAKKTNVRTTASGGIYWTGTIVETQFIASLPNGELTLFMKNNYLAGTLRQGDQVFDITPGANGTVKVVELDLLNNPNPDEDCYFHEEVETQHAMSLPQSTAELRAATASPTMDEEGHYIVDILVLYPAAVASLLGSTAAERTASVEYRIVEANEIFENSEINVRFRLAHHEINDIVPANAPSAVDVRIKSVTALRAQYGADIASHWNMNGSAGSGYVLTDNSKIEETGYNTSKYSDIISRFTFVHECGHNLGALHDRYDYRERTELTNSRPYYQFGKVFPTYRTIMAYTNCVTVGGESGSANCPRIKHFSNPNVLYNGVPTGVEGTEPSSLIDGGPADNARQINRLAEKASSCNNPVTVTPPPTEETIPISTRAELESIKDNLSGRFQLTQDIDLSEGGDWIPIAGVFTGKLYGDNHSIKNISINSDAAKAGLFEELGAKAFIEGVNIVGGSIISLAANAQVGGIAGYISGAEATVTKCSNSASIRATGATAQAGGIVGSIEGKFAAITSNFNKGAITGGIYAGGIVGRAADEQLTVTIRNCYSQATISSAVESSYVAGIVGYMYNVPIDGYYTVENCYATGSVVNTGNGTAAGIVGRVWDSANTMIQHNVALQDLLTGNPSNTFPILVSDISIGTKENYSNSEMLLNGEQNTNETEWTGAAVTLADAKTKVFYTTAPLAWNFTDTWTIEEGTFPILKWEVVMDPVVTTYTVTFAVEDTNGIAITDAVVTFDDIVNAAGNYVFTDIAADTYDYLVAKEDYETVSGNVTVTDANVTVPVTLAELVSIQSVDADAIVATKYYNLQGVEVVPTTTGVYIVKNTHASGKISSSKELKGIAGK